MESFEPISTPASVDVYTHWEPSMDEKTAISILVDRNRDYTELEGVWKQLDINPGSVYWFDQTKFLLTSKYSYLGVLQRYVLPAEWVKVFYSDNMVFHDRDWVWKIHYEGSFKKISTNEARIETQKRLDQLPLIIQELTTLLARFDVHYLKIELVGSVATGSSTMTSDIDLLVHIPRDQNYDIHISRMLSYKIQSNLQLPYAVQVISKRIDVNQVDHSYFIYPEKLSRLNI